MSDDELPKPPRVTATTEFLAESEAKQAAYAAARHRHVVAFLGRADDVEDEAVESGPADDAEVSPALRRARRRIEDRRQLGFDL